MTDVPKGQQLGGKSKHPLPLLIHVCGLFAFMLLVSLLVVFCLVFQLSRGADFQYRVSSASSYTSNAATTTSSSFAQKSTFGGCGCVEALLDDNGDVFQQGFFTLGKNQTSTSTAFSSSFPFPSKCGPCHACPEGAICKGGTSKPVPQLGYWGNPDCPVAFSACQANLESNQMNQSFVCFAPTTGTRAGEAFGTCREGHHGVLCHKCKDGYGREDLTSPFCVKCRGIDMEDSTGGRRKARLWHFLFLVGETLYSSAMMQSLIFTGMEADKRDKPEMSQLLKVLFSYLGMTELLLSGNTSGWPKSLHLFLNTHKPPTDTSRISSFDCWFSNTMHEKSTWTYTLQVVPKLCSAAICTAYLYLYSYRVTRKFIQAKRKGEMPNGSSGMKTGMKIKITSAEEGKGKIAFPKLLLLIDEDMSVGGGGVKAELRFLKSMLIFVRKLLPRVAIVTSTTMWPFFVSWALGFLACGSYPKSFVTACDSMSYRSVMAESTLLWEFDKEVECFKGLHAKMLEYVSIPILLVIGFPFFVFYFLKRNSDKMYVDDRFDYTYGFLYREYEQKYFYWEFVVQCRTFALTALITYFGSSLVATSSLSELQTLLLLLVVFFSMLLHNHFLPYVSDLVDRAHQVALIDSAVIIMASMFFNLRIDYPLWNSVREALGLFIALLHVGTLGYMGLLITMATLKTYAMHADKNHDNIVSIEEAEDYFGKSRHARLFIWILKLFKLVVQVEGEGGVEEEKEKDSTSQKKKN